MTQKYTVKIDSDLEELIPSFMANSREEISEMRRAIESSDIETLRRLGHSTKGAGRGYGFSEIGEMGLKIETAAAEGEISEAIRQIDALEDYLNRVEIIFEP